MSPSVCYSAPRRARPTAPVSSAPCAIVRSGILKEESTMSTPTTGHRSGRRLAALLGAVAIAVAACGGGGASPSAGPVTLNALFMKQAAYSEDNVKEMAAAFTAANPKVTVNLEFVAYDALHDKIVTSQAGGAGTYDTVLMDAIWPAEFAKANLVVDITEQDPRRVQERRLRVAHSPARRIRTSSMPCPGSTTRSSSSTTRRCWPTPASALRPRPGMSFSPRPRRSRTRASWSTRWPGAGRRRKPRSATGRSSPP